MIAPEAANSITITGVTFPVQRSPFSLRRAIVQSGYRLVSRNADYDGTEGTTDLP